MAPLPCLAQTWGKGHEGGIALELALLSRKLVVVKQPGPSNWVGYRCRHKAEESGRFPGGMCKVAHKLGRTEATGKVGLIFCSQDCWGLPLLELGACVLSYLVSPLECGELEGGIVISQQDTEFGVESWPLAGKRFFWRGWWEYLQHHAC